MKKAYTKPLIEIEAYELSASIAANCGTVITQGPEAPDITACDEWVGIFHVGDDLNSINGNTSFYESGLGACDCYYTASGKGYFTS